MNTERTRLICLYLVRRQNEETGRTEGQTFDDSGYLSFVRHEGISDGNAVVGTSTRRVDLEHYVGFGVTLQNFGDRSVIVLQFSVTYDAADGQNNL